MENLQRATIEEAQEVLESEDLGRIRDYMDNHFFIWNKDMAEICEKLRKVQLRLIQEGMGETEKIPNGTYFWAKDEQGNNRLIIEVNERRCVCGKVVLDALDGMKDSYSEMSIEEALELERRHWGGWEFCNLTEEFEVLKQTPEYKALEEAYKNRTREINA